MKQQNRDENTTPKPDFLADKHALGRHSPAEIHHLRSLAWAAVLVSYRQKRKINTQLFRKLFYRRTKTKHKVKSEPIASEFTAQIRWLKMIAGLGKWREGDQLVTMWVNEGRLPLNVNI